jgi:hypothetical protein
MARCCGGGTCSCRIEAGPRIAIVGVGSLQDPFVISADVGFAVADNTTFDVALTGLGTEEDPFTIAVGYASTAKLSHLPDVSDTPPANGQVLGYNTGTQTWGPIAPTTAPTGAVSHDTSLTGDGSAGSPLQVREDPDGFLATNTDGLGLSDEGVNSIVRHFADEAERTAADPAPTLNALSTVESDPGVVSYWTGTQWLPQESGIDVVVSAGEFLALSGGYAGGPVVMFFKQISDVTDEEGNFAVLTADDLQGYAGVLHVNVQEQGPNGWTALTNHTIDSVTGTAYRADDGLPFASSTVTATVQAWLY